ncbi:Voltage dependent potassium channel [Trema orientale]|uniref:Voltage dependent potassium channel n=1 Tax=Trema orientale TaxID=63057 RepID=A0A2P5FGE3_TREOI|nr:Voltage dependent potassium channel [Trema orientale]
MHHRGVAPFTTGGATPELEAIQLELVSKSLDGNLNHDLKQFSKRAFDQEHLWKKPRKSMKLMMREILDQHGPYLSMLNTIFLASWVIAVLTDPLFLYIPTLKEDQKCLKMDTNLKNVALVFRSITDFFYILHITFQLLIGFMPKGYLDLKGKGFLKYALSRARKTNWSYILIDLLAVLPVPQLVILVFFPGMIGPGFGSVSTRKFLLEMLLIFQYIPRSLQIYLSYEQLKKTRDAFTTPLWVRGTFNLFLYINASYILGSFWYFFSVQREMECWHIACKDHFACFPTNLVESCNNIDSYTRRNVTALDEFCPINSPDTSIFDFGMYLAALQSGIVGSTDVPNKVLQGFWWGLRNLSSFGSNLQTSSNPWETCFAALLSMLGLLLFLYLIGNLQLYMQLATQRREDKRYNKKVEIKRLMKAKEPDIQLWASTHKLREPEKVKSVIMTYMLDTLEKDRQLNFKQLQKKLLPYLLRDESNQEMGELDMGHLRIIHLKLEAIVSKAKRHHWENTEQTAQLWMLKNGIPRHIIPMIKKYVQYRLQNHKGDIDLVILLSVPALEHNDDEVLEEMIKHLRPVTYAENSYIIRKGEPIGYVLFVTHGVVLVFGDESTNCVAKTKGDYYGDELVGWQLKSASYSDLPVSTTNVQSHTKVEALILNAVDLKHVLSKYWWKFPISTKYEEQLRKRFAADAIGEAWKRSLQRRQKDDQLGRWTAVRRRLRGATAWIH